MSTKTASDYLAMQKNFYEDTNKTPETIVGAYGFHENFPYETNLLYLHGDIRKPIFDMFKDKKAFDIACGEGRMIRRMEKIFGLGCDGCDISEHMARSARERCPHSRIYVTDGNNCGDAPSDTYDFAFCTISLQHIASYAIRSQIIADALRILKPDGKMTLQLLMSKHFPFTLDDHVTGRHELVRKYTKLDKHAAYFDDRFDAKGTNSGCDGVIGTADISRVMEDFRTYFNEVGIWFHDISVGRPFPQVYPAQLPGTHPNCHFHDGYHGTHFVFLHGVAPKTP